MKLGFSSYGMTETCGTCARTLPFDPTCSGTIGPPQPVNEIKLVDVPSMGYTSEDKPHPRGELCVRGVNCFTEYYKGMYMSREQDNNMANTARREKHEEHP
jgi:long-chain acyl-CoA synthetase